MEFVAVDFVVVVVVFVSVGVLVTVDEVEGAGEETVVATVEFVAFAGFVGLRVTGAGVVVDTPVVKGAVDVFVALEVVVLELDVVVLPLVVVEVSINKLKNLVQLVSDLSYNWK